jgi:aminoglycoside phosphotransferase
MDLLDGRSVFVKHTRNAPRGMFRAEAEGLAWLAAPGSIHVPTVIGVDADWIALGWIEQGGRTPATDEALAIRRAAISCLKRVPLDRKLRLLGIRISGLCAAGEPLET